MNSIDLEIVKKYPEEYEKVKQHIEPQSSLAKLKNPSDPTHLFIKNQCMGL